jgi:hypothetical protein
MGAIFATSVAGWTPVAHADGASALANSSYHGLRNAAVTDITKVTEVFIGGEATSSTVNRMALRRTSTVVSTPTNVAPAPMGQSGLASSQQQFVLATTGPTIASTTHLGTYALNTFGGIIREAMTPGQEPVSVGTAQPNAEFILDSISGTGVVSTNVIFEAL